jgi:Ser/Thr protein kinase RdoA (MazF antagonist)
VAKNGEYTDTFKGKPFALFSYLEGEHLNGVSGYLEAARSIGTLNALTSNYNPKHSQARDTRSAEYCWNSAGVSAARIKSRLEADQRLSWLRDQLDSLELPNNLPTGVCHGDANPSNFLFSEGRVSAVLDFDQSCYTQLLCDLASLIYWWTWPRKGELDFAKSKNVIEAYESGRKLNNPEKIHLFDALKLINLTSVAWFLDQDDDLQHGKARIDYLEAIGRHEIYRRLF